MVVGLGVPNAAAANPGPHGDDVFYTEPLPLTPAPPPDRLGLGIGLIAGGVVSFAGGAALQPSWLVKACTLAEPSTCTTAPRHLVMGSVGVVLMVAGVGLTIPGAILTHRARMRRKAESAKLRAMIGPRFVGLAGRF